MKYLIVAGIVLTLLLLSLVIGKKNKQDPDKFLILYLCFATLKQAYFYLETISFFQHSSFMLLGKGIYLLNAPLFFLYVYSLLTSKKRTLQLYTMLFLPFIAYVIHFFFYYIRVFDQAILSIEAGLLTINGTVSISWLLFVILFLLIEPVYLTWFYILLKKYKKGLLASVSNIDHMQLRWLHTLFYLWLIITVVFIPIGILSVGIAWIPTGALELMMQAASVVFFFILGYYGLKQTTIFTDPKSGDVPPKELKNSRYSRSGLSAEQAKQYHTELLALMEKEKPYLNGELKAADLAQLLNISVNNLSQVLSQVQQQNFFDFVNSYRVKDVISKMEDPKNSHLTLLAMALDSGFNSKTSFNTVFKKATHQTPSDYYKAIKNKAQKNP